MTLTNVHDYATSRKGGYRLRCPVVNLQHITYIILFPALELTLYNIMCYCHSSCKAHVHLPLVGFLVVWSCLRAWTPAALPWPPQLLHSSAHFCPSVCWLGCEMPLLYVPRQECCVVGWVAKFKVQCFDFHTISKSDSANGRGQLLLSDRLARMLDATNTYWEKKGGGTKQLHAWRFEDCPQDSIRRFNKMCVNNNLRLLNTLPFLCCTGFPWSEQQND